MSNEVLPFVSNEVVEAFQGFDDDYLADVLRVWDCYEQDWHDGFTTVFRFENDDLLVWKEMGGLKTKRGAVVTQNPIELEPDACLSWMSDPGYSDLFGEKGLSTTLLESIM